VRGTDAFGNTGALACTLVTLTAPVTATATATAEATAEATTTATTAPSDTPAPTATSGPATQPPSVGFASGGFPIIPVLIGILALLIIIGVILFFALGRRRRDDGRYPR
jgi:carbohydrate-binding DOMON domain-containing protein